MGPGQAAFLWLEILAGGLSVLCGQETGLAARLASLFTGTRKLSRPGGSGARLYSQHWQRQADH